MKRIFILLLSVCVLSAAAAATGSFTDRTPAYFVDLYGYPASSKNVGNAVFTHMKYGSANVKGRFSAREFRSGELSIKATFEVPSLRLAGVRLQLPRQWTPEQLNAALSAYGSDWSPTNHNGIIREWAKPDGSKAVYILTWLEIQSPAIAKAVELVISEMEAKRKVVPKF
ncbi:MAG: hypothetical protein K9N01_12880 [Cephaloticoccus sp.]|nr:hypothetical protein [Cephaloticoccus sp.]